MDKIITNKNLSSDFEINQPTYTDKDFDYIVNSKNVLTIKNKNNTQRINRFNALYSISSKKHANYPCKTDKDFIDYSLKKINHLYTAILYNILDMPWRKERLTKVTFEPLNPSINLILRPGFNQLYRALTDNYPPLSEPPIEKTRLGRLNKKNKPVFYLAMSKNTTKKEVPNYKFIYQYKVKKNNATVIFCLTIYRPHF